MDPDVAAKLEFAYALHENRLAHVVDSSEIAPLFQQYYKHLEDIVLAAGNTMGDIEKLKYLAKGKDSRKKIVQQIVEDSILKPENRIQIASDELDYAILHGDLEFTRYLLKYAQPSEQVKQAAMIKPEFKTLLEQENPTKNPKRSRNNSVDSE